MPARPHIITITLPTGELLKFQPTLNPQCQLLTPPMYTTMGFEPLPGTNATLTPASSPSLLVLGSTLETNIPGQGTQPYDPDQYVLTLKDGRQFTLDQNFGLTQMTDRNGNTLTIDDNGITHSSGKSITFTRDADNRITVITDPIGNTIQYNYDINGDLVSVTDQENNTTQFTYNNTHGLTDIVDPRGITPIRNEYDNQGRLIAHIDADGNRIDYTHNIGTRQEIVEDQFDKLTVYEYDDDGNIVSITDPNANTTTYTYDDRGNKLTETDAENNTRKLYLRPVR